MFESLTETTIEWTEDSKLEDRLRRWAGQVSASSRLVDDEPLDRHSSLRIGGLASRWIEVGTVDDLETLVAALGGEPFVPIGLGSNTLFPDEGIEAPVVRLVDELARWTIERGEDDDRAFVEVMAGAINAHLVRGLLSEGWVGAEFLTLIPGTFGGAVVLNAGTREKELAAILDSVWIAVPDRDRRVWTLERWPADRIELEYRRSELPEGSLVIGGRIEVRRGDVDEARRRMRDDKERRNRTQPYRLASVGSTFANPEGDYAGRLIDEAGLKGTSIGGAKISSKHANFFINESDATADDFLHLMALARYRVRTQFGVELRPEVKFEGFDGRARMRDWERKLEDRDV